MFKTLLQRFYRFFGFFSFYCFFNATNDGKDGLLLYHGILGSPDQQSVNKSHFFFHGCQPFLQDYLSLLQGQQSFLQGYQALFHGCQTLFYLCQPAEQVEKSGDISPSTPLVRQIEAF